MTFVLQKAARCAKIVVTGKHCSMVDAVLFTNICTCMRSNKVFYGKNQGK